MTPRTRKPVTVEHLGPAPVTPGPASHKAAPGAGTVMAPPDGARRPSPLHDRERAVAEAPDPVTGAASGHEAAPDRVRARRTPAGAGDNDPPPAGTTAIAAAMSEDRGPDSLDSHVRRYLRDLGLHGYHTHDSRRSQGGFPDWTITGKRTMFRELKTQRGKVSAAQQEWLDALTGAGDDAAVWRPADLLSGRIARELTAISRYARAA